MCACIYIYIYIYRYWVLNVPCWFIHVVWLAMMVVWTVARTEARTVGSAQKLLMARQAASATEAFSEKVYIRSTQGLHQVYTKST